MPCDGGGYPDPRHEIANRAVRLLCRLAKAPEVRALAKGDPDFAEWLAEHDEADRVRLAREAADEEHNNRVAAIAAKLTDDELRILGHHRRDFPRLRKDHGDLFGTSPDLP